MEASSSADGWRHGEQQWHDGGRRAKRGVLGSSCLSGSWGGVAIGEMTEQRWERLGQLSEPKV